MPAEKIFVLDTSVLLYSPNSIFSFGSKTVCLPIQVLEELDNMKTGLSEKGRNARIIIRRINELRSEGSLVEGVPVNEKGGILRVVAADKDWQGSTEKIDNQILGVCKTLTNPVLITKDICLMLKADALGITAQDYLEDNKVKNSEDIYTGVMELEVGQAIVNSAYVDEYIQHDFTGVYPNQFLRLISNINPKHSAMVKVSNDASWLRLVKTTGVWGVTPRNARQHFAVDLLLDDTVKLVTLSGLAGSGKTMLALAAGLHKVLEERKYENLVIARPTVGIEDEDLGFLPGSIEEKFAPWLRPIRDALEFLMGNKKTAREEFEAMIDSGQIKIEPLAYIRGRSFNDSYVILDEAQNTTKHTIKTFLTRLGENSKAIITGDVMQIDSQKIDSVNNGLTQAVERFKDVDISGHVTLNSCERSTLAQIAATLL